MRRVDGLESLPLALTRPVVTVGTFDGVHLGHQQVLREVVEEAARLDGESVVVTFTRPPKSVFERRSPDCLTSLDHRLLLFDRMGIHVSLVLRFTPQFASMSAGDFCRNILQEGLGARELVMGYDAAFGRGREGSVAYLREHADEFGFRARSVPPLAIDGEVVSSTRIRQAVVKGRLDAVEKLLGRPYSVYGTVVHGDARGRRLGYPTANLDLHHEVTPPDGVYAAEAALGGETIYPALASVGTRPTFATNNDASSHARTVEVYILGFDEQIYGRNVEVRFVRRLRDQCAFADGEGLMEQIGRDLDAAEAVFRGIRKSKVETRKCGGIDGTDS